MEKLAIETGFDVLTHSATDGSVGLCDQAMDELSESQYQAWFQFHLSVCTDPSLIGMSNHGLIMGRRRNERYI